jgi:alkylhydroperoxidase family enzyme
MDRIPSHTIDNAPAATRGLLGELIQFSPTGRLLNMHAQMAHAPAVLDAYTSLRRATSQLGTLPLPVRAALMVAAAAADDSQYALAVIMRLALRAGWTDEQVTALRDGKGVGDSKTDALVAVVREASVQSGRVNDTTWHRAVDAGWTDEQLAEAFAYLGLAVFTSYFLNYAETEIDVDVPAPPAAGLASATQAGSE